MGIIISLLIMWLMFKILQWAFSSLSDSNNDKETSNHDNVAIDSNSNEEPSSYNVGSIDSSNDKETSNHNVGAIDDKPSDLKYNNEVYISLRNKVQKAYESFKKSGYNIVWYSEFDGFIILEDDGSLSDGSSSYMVKVHSDDQYSSKFDDSFYIVVTYSILFDLRDYDDYKEQAEYLNNYFKKKERPGISFSVGAMDDPNLGTYSCYVVIPNNDTLCKKTKELGEAELFKQLMSEARELMSEAREFYYDGQELYGDKETSNHNVGAIDDKPSDLKYNNEVYISLRNKVQKAYESYKKSGYDIEWNSDIDGFILSEEGSLSDGCSSYMVNVECDDQNLVELNDPFYIVVSCGIVFDRSDYNDYEERVKYLNNYFHKELKKFGIYFTVGTVGKSNLRVFFCNVIIDNNNNLCKATKELGEAEVFKRLMDGAREYYCDGQEIYGDKDTSSHNVRVIDNEPSDLKYDNEGYISFRNKVQKAYESFKKSGHKIEWNSDLDRFILSEATKNNKKTSNHDVGAIDNEPSDLKYKNEVYISFRNKVQKAYESFKKSGYKIEWNSDIDGFILSEATNLSLDRLVYMVNVGCDDQNLFESNNPFWITVSYGVILWQPFFSCYKDQVEYLNNYLEEIERPEIFFASGTVGNSNLSVYFCNLVVDNNNYLCKKTEELGEAELFKQLMNDVRRAYYDGRELYWDKLERDKEKNSFI